MASLVVGHVGSDRHSGRADQYRTRQHPCRALRAQGRRDAGCSDGGVGLNNVSALSFLLLAFMIINAPAALSGDQWPYWLGIGMLRAFAAGLAFGFGIGWWVGLLGTRLKTLSKDVSPDDFPALTSMTQAYADPEAISATGFLAAFAGGAGLRSAKPDPHAWRSTTSAADELSMMGNRTRPAPEYLDQKSHRALMQKARQPTTIAA